MRLPWAPGSYKAVSGIFDFTPTPSRAECLLLHEEQRRSFPIVNFFE